MQSNMQIAGPAGFSKEQYTSVKKVLSELTDRLHKATALLLNSSGRVLAHQSGTGGFAEPSTLGTLAAGTFSAAGEMAGLMGEPEAFRMTLYEGSGNSLLVCPAGEDTCLAVAFAAEIPLGMVRLMTKRTLARLQPLLNTQEPGGDAAALFDERFQTMLGEELDRSFNETY